jgi:RimJ/RimL family protein N-acetyltransferase
MLEGKLVNLRPIEKRDLKYIKEWINDYEVQYYSQEQFPFYFNNWIIRNIYKDGIKGKKPIFIIEDKHSNVIGELWLESMNRNRGTTELVIIIGRNEYRSKGYGRDAINTIREFCFERLGLESIYLKVFSFNERAINCYKSCGFRIIGRGDKKVVRYGVQYDELVMELRKVP